MIVMIDNYDSFTYNLVQYFGELGQEVVVYRNDEITLDELADLKPEKLVISPGPCTPNEAGISMGSITLLATEIPILGVCLGHEAIAQAYGGQVVHARQVMHGKLSPVHHSSQGIFQNIETPFLATRYHSLIVDKATLPDCFDITAWTETPAGDVDEIMAIKHKDLPIEGVQFHPESIMTRHGHQLLQNFLGS